jgi:hypothetical protein
MLSAERLIISEEYISTIFVPEETSRSWFSSEDEGPKFL